MNTVEKGNQFEKKSLEIIRNLKKDGLFGVKDYVNIISKAKYYSNLRKAEIEFDLVIEFKPPNAERAMMTYFIECKNYDKRVPVGQVEKFHSDIKQVSGVNAKGILISNGPFQKSAYSFAESTGMMIIEGESVDDFKIVLHKRSSENNSSIPFIKDLLNNDLIDDGLTHMEKLIDRELLNILTKSDNKIAYGIDNLSKSDIELVASNELNKLDSMILEKAYGLNVKQLTEYLKTEYQIETIYFEPNESDHLGTCDIDKKIIGISKRVANTERELFVLGHEFGHYILHQKLSINQELLNSFSDSRYNFRKGRNSLKNPRHWIEWQANYFSASLILSKTSIIAKTWQYQNSQTKLFFDDNHTSRKEFNLIIRRLANHFCVSYLIIIYRLKELNMIVDKTKIKSIGELLSEWKSEFIA